MLHHMTVSLSAMRGYADLLESRGVGYSQGDRWSFNPARDGLFVYSMSNCDCSSSCGAIGRAGGINFDTRDPFYTGNFASKAKNAGCELISVSTVKSQSTLISMLHDGDFLLGPGHVVFCYNPTKWWSAENDERGKSTGGKAGDQTGLEARFRLPYMRSKGWTYIVRPQFAAKPLAVITPNPVNTVVKTAPRHIDYNDASFIRVWQTIAGVNSDGIRGPKTTSAVKSIQRRVGVSADGVPGKDTTLAYLLSLPNIYRGKTGLPKGAVSLVQWIVRSRVDGEFGSLTEADVKASQAWAGVQTDGVVGDATKWAIVR